MTGTDANLHALTDGSAAGQSGVPHGEALVHFAEAAVEAGPGRSADPDDAALREAREALLAAVGPEGLVDACGVVAQFQRMDRIADATGIPLDAPVDLMTADVRAEIGIDGLGAAARAPRPGAVKRALGGLARRAATGAAKVVTGRVRRGRG